MAKCGTALPWNDRDAFADRMLECDLCSYDEARRQSGTVLFDRGIPDIIGYRTLCRLEIPGDLARAAGERPYNRHVFIAPPWRKIYTNDVERRQDWAEAVATHDVMVRAYGDLGHVLVPLPLVAPDERAEFVLHWINSAQTA